MRNEKIFQNLYIFLKNYLDSIKKLIVRCKQCRIAKLLLERIIITLLLALSMFFVFRRTERDFEEIQIYGAYSVIS